ncbi:MAG: Rpn family recombination-promoting nuclease/putative transposase [Rickettsia endosymbiont of Sergentomyia squamirostris]|uniref:Rpn family recombination-promoting nuclease/putative transposase n=1 Tax=Candidatus Tisiphia endosymbiont of Sergentomyia squamirostris TaxID=3113639 RepID=A0AAT9GAJ5_9RICK
MTTKRSKHDQIFRKAMENPLVAHEFLNAHLPKHIKALIDFPSLKFENTSFVELNLRDSISDVLFSAKFDGKDGYLFLLVEHQSSADHFMTFRLLRYMLNICDRYLTLNPKAKSLPLIYPVIFFNGAGDYNAPRNLWELFEDNLLAKEIWTNDYQIVNVNDIPDEQLKQRVWSGIFEFFAKHIRERDLLRRWQEIAYMLPELVKVSIGYNYIELLLCYTLTRINKEDKLELEKLLTSKLNQETGTRLMGSLAQHWEQIGEARGEARGEAKLIRMLMRKGSSVKEIATMTDLPISKINELLKIDIQGESPK